MTRLRVRIQHTPARDNDPVFVQLVRDLEYPHKVVTDERLPVGQENRTFLTYKRCLEAGGPYYTHRLVLQDDIEVCRNFIPAVKRAIEAKPDQLIAFFLGNKPSQCVIELFQACDRGENWARLDNRSWCPAQALCWPSNLAESFLEYAAQRYRPDMPDDELIGHYLYATDQHAWATIPNLVQHVHYQNSSIGAGRGGAYRRAACFIGDYDPLEFIDWMPPGTPRLGEASSDS